jgi:hypothetical protein
MSENDGKPEKINTTEASIVAADLSMSVAEYYVSILYVKWKLFAHKFFVLLN